MRAIFAVALLGLLAGCTTPEERAQALYSDFSAHCRQMVAAASTEITSAGGTVSDAQWSQGFHWCMDQMLASYQAQESNRLAMSSALLGYGAAMSAQSAPQSYTVPRRGFTCATIPNGGGTTMTNCY